MLLATLCLSVVWPQAVAQTAKATAIDTLLTRLHHQQLFNGAIVVGQKGNILLSKGYGYAHFAKELPFTPDTPADGGSNATTFTAAAMLMLAQQHQLSLLDSVQQYVQYPYTHTSLWNLLTHSTGGLPDYDYYFEKLPADEVLSSLSMLRILNEQKPPLGYAPDTNFSYDTPAFDVASAVVAQVSGMPYLEFLYTHFFTPLQMQHSGGRPSLLEQWKTDRAIGYRYQNGSLQVDDIGDREGFYGGGNLWFSAADLYRWGQSFYYKPLLDASLIRVITSTVAIKSKVSRLSLGGWYEGRSRHAHYYWGSVAGFYSFVYWDTQQQFTIALVSNVSIPQWARPALTNALIDALEGRPIPAIKEPQAEKTDPAQWPMLAGTYDTETAGRVTLYLKDTQPFLQVQTGMEYRLFQVDDKTFYVPGLDWWLSFQDKQNNIFQTLLWRSSHEQSVGKRVVE